MGQGQRSRESRSKVTWVNAKYIRVGMMLKFQNVSCPWNKNKRFYDTGRWAHINVKLLHLNIFFIFQVLDEIRQYLKVCASKAPPIEPVKTHRECVLNEWRQLGLVVDRVLFCIYIIISVLVAVVMLH